MVGDALSAGAMIIQSGVHRLEGSAQAIARQAIADPATGAPPSIGVIQPLIEQRLALYEVQAGAKVIQTANKVLGSLLDAFA